MTKHGDILLPPDAKLQRLGVAVEGEYLELMCWKCPYGRLFSWGQCYKCDHQYELPGSLIAYYDPGSGSSTRSTQPEGRSVANLRAWLAAWLGVPEKDVEVSIE